MIHWTEEFGTFTCNDADYKEDKEIVICSCSQSNVIPKEKELGRNVVLCAIKLCKTLNMEIIDAVKYNRRNDYHQEYISFKVHCTSKSSKAIYEYGRWGRNTSSNPAVSEKDLRKYEEKFGTRLCKHKGFRKKYWFRDSWDGNSREFTTLKNAIEAARKQYGVSVSIYTNHRYGLPSEIAKIAEASGFTPS